MNTSGLIFLVVILLIDSLIKSQRRAQRRGGDWQEILRPRGMSPQPGTKRAQPEQRRMVGRRITGRQLPTPGGEQRSSGLPPWPIQAGFDGEGEQSEGLLPGPERGSMDFVSAEGTSEEWALTSEEAQAGASADAAPASGELASTAPSEVAVAVNSILTAREEYPGGPLTAIALSEVLGPPRAHSPWHPRAGAGQVGALRKRPG